MEESALKYTLSKQERLCSHNVIDQLFAEGKGFIKYPFRIVYMVTELPDNVPVQMFCSVSKRKFKRAVKRNLLKRRMKEAYRLKKHSFYQTVTDKNIQLAVAIMYLPKEEMDYTQISQGMDKALDKLKSIVVSL